MTTRTSSPLNPPLKSEMRLNNRIYEVTLVTAITQNGVSYNEVVLPPGVNVPASEGGRMVVPNAHLLFEDGNSKGRTYRRLRADKSVTYHKTKPTLAEGDTLFKWFLFDWKEEA